MPDKVNLLEKGAEIATGFLFAVGMAIVRFCLAPGAGLKDGVKTAVGCIAGGVIATMLFQYTTWTPLVQFCTAALMGGFGKEIYSVLVVIVPAAVRNGLRLWVGEFAKNAKNTGHGNRDLDA